MEEQVAFLGARELARRLRAGEFSSLSCLSSTRTELTG
jgi:hypothetical protein